VLPSAIVIEMDGQDVSRAMAALRRGRRGAAVPVVLVGSMGRDVEDLAGVLDLGADEFVERSDAGGELCGVLAELVGGAAPADLATGAAGRPEDAAPDRTVVLDEPPAADPPGVGEDGALRRVRRTLERVDRSRGGAAKPPKTPLDDDLAFVGADDPGPADSGIRALDADLSAVLRPASETPAPLVVPPGRTAPVSDDARTQPAIGVREVSETPVPSATAASPPFVPVRRALGTLPVDRTGDLADLEPARLLSKLHRIRFSGTVVFEVPVGRKTLWLREGVVLSAQGTAPEDRLLSGLLARGRISRRQFDAACRLVAKDPRRAGTLLVEAGFLKAGELPDVLRQHVRDVAASVLRCLAGTFTLDPDAATDVPVELDLPPGRFLLEGIDRFVPRAALRAATGPVLAARVRPPPAGDYDRRAWQDAYGLTDDEVALVAALDGRVRLEVLEERWADRNVRFWPLVYVLHVEDRLDLLPEPVPEAGAADEAVDEARILDMIERVRAGDLFEVLGVERTADVEAVRRAAADLREVFAQDRLDPEVRARMGAALDEIRTVVDQAEAILTDDALRTAYLSQLEPA